MNPDPVVLINAFEVPDGQDEAFLDGWERARAFLATQQGYLSTRLHRSLSPAANFRYINVAVWQSAQAFQAATSQPEFSSAAIPFPFHASLYQVVREDPAELPWTITPQIPQVIVHDEDAARAFLGQPAGLVASTLR